MEINRHKLIIIFFFISISLFSQESILDTNNYRFIKYSANIINNDEIGLSSFFTKLQKLEEAKINKISIFHLGDSHVAGLSFPNRLEYNFEINFGKLGRTVYTHSNPVKKIKRRSHRRRRKGSDEIEFDYFFNQRPESFYKNDSLLIYDSLAVDTDTTWFHNIPIQKRGIYYSIYGNTGKSFSYFINSSVIQNYIIDTKPDLAIITLGTNDAFGLNYDSSETALQITKLIKNIRLANPTASVLVTIPAESFIKHITPNLNILSVRNVIKDVCIKNKACYWDFYNIMGGQNSMDIWLENELAYKDKVHFTKPGYQLIADMLYVAIMKSYVNFLEKGLIK